MDQLWAPWRIQYILAPKPPPADASLFTRIAQSNDDEANYVVARDRTCFAPTGSAVTAWSMKGSQANDGGVPQGQACVTLSGLIARVV